MGQATLAIREACQEVKGRMVMQDQAQVIGGVQDLLPTGVEAVAHDFFQPQPITGMRFFQLLS
jgi:hypothetical protein